MSNRILEARGLVKKFGQVAAVDGVSFELDQGEVLTLLGPSGCGKTTTLRMVAGFEKPDGGEIEIQERLVYSSSRRQNVPPEKRELGMVFQSYAVWPHMSVFENVAYPLSARGINQRDTKEKVFQTLELVGLDGYADRSPMHLSGGQQQRVALARALVYSPRILLLDEPLSNLDANLRNQMRVELKRLQEQTNVTMLFVTHDQIEAMALSTRLAVMNKGKIEQIGSPQEVYETPETRFVESFLGQVLRFRSQVIECLADGVLVSVEGLRQGSLRVQTSDRSLGVGMDVLVAIRPEDLLVQSPGAGSGSNVLRCSVENVLYLGSECQLLLRFNNSPITLILSRAAVPTVHKEVDLHLPADRLRVWLEPPTAQEARSISQSETPH